MAQSVISICNMALGHIGRSTTPILALTDPSVEARTCNLWYDIARQELLEAYAWSFGRQRVTLALHSDPPPIEWSQRYQQPANILSMRGLWNPLANQQTGGISAGANGALFSQGFWNGYYGDLSNAVPFERELSLDGSVVTILTNLASAIGVFTFDQQSVSLFSPGFINALAYRLASKMAYPISGKLPLAQELMKESERVASVAAGLDANQDVAEPVRDGYAMRARQ